MRRDGRFFRFQDQLRMGRGLCYGPFAPRKDGFYLPEQPRMEADLTLMRQLGTDFLRIYTLPDKVLMQTCAELKLGVMATVPWSDHTCFLDSRQAKSAAFDEFSRAMEQLAGSPALSAILVGNEIRSELVRWMGPGRVLDWLEQLIDRAREFCPDVPAGYANYPGTEALMPANADFIGLNVYLEEPEPYRQYLKRQQAFAGDKPLIITEFGKNADDSARQAEAWNWAMRIAAEEGVAAWTGFSFTDEWWRGGKMVDDWKFGITTAAREPRAAAAVFSSMPKEWPRVDRPPEFSVLVCTRNGDRTLDACLGALTALNPAPKEILVVDDGSTAPIQDIVRRYPAVRYERQEPMGLSVARNRAAELATGDIFVYTDDDCVPPVEWLLWMGRLFSDDRWAAGGGPNLPPPPRNHTEALVAAAPGGPTHVLLSAEEAEHVPGCNLAVRREAFEAIGGFDPIYTAAGDDVDFCWRLRDAGLRIGFHAAATTWHHRRFQKRAYFRQQAGYGKAEAFLVARHPGKFGPSGGARWSGQIYGGADAWYLQGAWIYQGVMGLAPYQLIYPSPMSVTARFLRSPWWFGAILLSLFLLFIHPLLAVVPLGMTLASAAPLWRYCRRAPLTPPAGGWRDRLALCFLTLTAPVLRAAKRRWWMRELDCRPSGERSPPFAMEDDACSIVSERAGGEVTAFWSESGADRHELLERLKVELMQSGVPLRFSQWESEDLAVPAGSGGWLSLVSVTEYHQEGKTLTKVRISAPFDRWKWSGALAWLPGLWIPRTLDWRARMRKLRGTVRKAAEAIGMTGVDSGR